MQKFISYVRVSTVRQGASGLGLQAQQEAITTFLKNRQNAQLLGEFREIESGKRSDRPQLTKALQACRKHKAVLVIAKLDRLARNVHFVSGLLESGVKFVACDIPEADRTFLQMVSVFAEHEARMIATRTRAALQAWKVRNPDKKLGNPRLSATANAVRTAQSNEFARKLKATLHSYVASGLSQAAMAQELEKTGVPSAMGGAWSARQVRRILKRLEII